MNLNSIDTRRAAGLIALAASIRPTAGDWAAAAILGASAVARCEAAARRAALVERAAHIRGAQNRARFLAAHADSFNTAGA